VSLPGGGEWVEVHAFTLIFSRWVATLAASFSTSSTICGSGGGVAFGELADAADEGLRDTVQLALHSSGEGGQPLVVHHKGLDFVLGERGVIWRRDWLPSKTPVRCKESDWRRDRR
jgi:hypothetical protein